MKKILIIALGLLVAAACKPDGGFLEPKTNALGEASVFTDSIRTMQFLGRIYSDAGFTFYKGRWNGTSNLDESADDSEFKFNGVTQPSVVMYNGTLTPFTTFGVNDFWLFPWNNIRRVNLLLSKLPTTPLSAATQRRVAGEIRFLRAWYYHQLVSNFGGVPLIADKVYGLEDNLDLPRNTYTECINYIVSELDAAAAILPTNTQYAEENYGRITKGACLALKSRVLLFAASPLFNGSPETKDPELARIVSNPTYDASAWQKAADAALAVINSGNYALFKGTGTIPGIGFYQVFLTRVNNEYIFFLNRPANREYENHYNMQSRGGQLNGMPTQNIVDAFPMKNGKAITDPTSGYDAKNPYVNREPRFYNTIIYNESLYFLTSANSLQPVLTYEGAPSDGYSATGPNTGYFTRKMCDVNIAANSSTNTNRGWSIIRYAEMLLNYAEAINEAGQTALAYPKLAELRERAGIDPGLDNLYGMKAGMTKEEMREFVRNERRIELAYEDHRWNDIRRWKIAVAVNNGFNKRMRITRTGNTYTYQVTESIRRHNFRPEQYLNPLPDSEIRKMPSAKQNPGW